MAFNPNLSLAELTALLKKYRVPARQVRSAELPLPGSPQPLITPGSPVSVDPAGAAQDVAQLAGAAITNLITLLGQRFSINRRILLTTNADDQYGGNLQTAINAAATLTPPPSATAPVIVDILSPGTYTGNFVIPSSHIYLFAGSPGNTSATKLTSASSNTLTLPDTDSGVQGINIESTSASNSDSAVSIQSLGSNTNETVFFGCLISAPNGACAIRSQPGLFGLICIFFGCFVDGVTTILVEALGAGLAFVSGALSNEPGGTVGRAANGSALLFVSTYCANDSGGSGWIGDVDGAILAMLDVEGLNAANWARGTNGSVLFLPNSVCNNLSGTKLSLDATSTCFLGSMRFNTFSGNPYAAFSVAVPGNVLFMEDLDFAIGTIVPDTRPTTPKPGMGFYASDLVPARIINFVPGVGWIDGAGTPIP